MDSQTSQDSGHSTIGATSIVEILRARATDSPDRAAYIFLADGEVEARRMSYVELDRLARAIGAKLLQSGCSGERALLLFPPGLEFIAAFLGCLYSGVVAVPAYPPRKNQGLNRLTSIAFDARPRAVLTTSSLGPIVQAWVAQSSDSDGIKVIVTDCISEDSANDWQRQNLEPDSLAFLQYTSGSTAAPKGVMVTHGNIVANEEMIRRAFDQDESSMVVSWLPLYHDMGLIGGVLQPLYVGATCVLMPSMAFLQKPRRWLEAISRYRGTTSGGPNFAYDLCVRRISVEERSGLDLSSWRVAFNGAEPIWSGTLDRFARAFTSCGFRRSAFYPCYGLAEATLFVTGGDVGAGPRAEPVSPAYLLENCVAKSDSQKARLLIGSGHTQMQQSVIIVEPEDRTECAADRIGEIWVAGPNIAKGYWNRPQETEQYFHARLRNEDGEESAISYLRTGDLGFLKDGDLFVTGRLKDLIIVRGRNYYPQDIERTVEETHWALRPGCGAAFSIEGEDGDKVVVVQEVDRRHKELNAEAIIEAIRGAVAREHEFLLQDVVLIKHGTIQKTSSGKIQRHACRASYLKGNLEIIASSSVTSTSSAGYTADNTEPDGLSDPALVERHHQVVEFLSDQVAIILGLHRSSLDRQRPLVNLGIDSLAAVQLQHVVEERFGISISIANLLDGATIAETADDMLQSKTLSSEEEMSLPEMKASGEFPLSYGQRGLWFMQRLSPDSAAYHISVATKIEGELDVATLKRSFQAVVYRHPALRLTFHQDAGGDPIQRLHDSMEVDFTVVEAERWDEESLMKRLCEYAWRPFDLESGPLLRAVVFRRSAYEHAMIVAVHHLVADFWSLVVMFDELSKLYLADNAGAAADLAPQVSAYSDYVVWSRAQLAGSDGERLWNYWKEKLSPLPAIIDLPTDRPRLPVQTFRGSSRSLELGQELTEALQKFSRSSGASLFVVLVAAFKALLYRYTGQTDLAIGCPVAGRSRSQFDNLVGYFVNPVVLRDDASGNPTFQAFVDRVRCSTLEALEHQNYPFALLAERLNLVRDPSRTPLFQVMFALQKAQRAGQQSLSSFALGEAGSEVRLGPLSLSSLALSEKQVAFDLNLMMAETKSGISASLQYNCDLFDGETALRMLEQLRSVLTSAVANPQTRINRLDLLTQVERNQLLSEWNATAVEFDRHLLLHQIVEAQADRSPDKVAIISEGESLTYRQLESCANRLAHYLRAQGVGPEVIVGVYLDRSLNLVVAILGILKAGGVYLPLDPSHPLERLNLILESSRVPLVVTQERLRSGLSGHGARLLFIDSDWPEISAQLAERPASASLPSNLAYLLYTSGSLGWPKGVGVAHSAVINFLTSMACEPGLTADDIFLSVTTPSFDIFGLELYLPLMLGAQVILPSQETTADGAKLLNTLQESGATAMQATPATWRLLLAAGWTPQPGFNLLCGGEGLPWELARQLQPQTCSVWNLYGPTEATIWSAVYELREEEETSLVPIGKPIANTQLYVLDIDLKVAPLGVPGELMIGGDGLARGYWQLPELSAEKFIPDPFNFKPGARLYRTGDLARWRADGKLEFLGRLDNQVKVRGFRIELGEVESILVSHPEVRQAVVVAWKGNSGDQRLVGYVVPADGANGGPVDAARLRSFLLQKLPEAYVPSLFVTLKSLPLTPNGKVDRKALPTAELSKPSAEHVELRSDLERLVAEIWKAALQADRIGRDDNFFDLGGHSLLLAQVQKRLSDAGYEVPMLDLLRQPTVGALAEHLGQGAARSVAALEGSRRGSARRSCSATTGREIAVVGMSGRFPKAGSVDQLWSRLCEGDECISFFSDEELIALGVEPQVLEDPNYVKAGGVLEGADLFDAAFFGFHPREAEWMDPQHRIFLQCAWQALDDAGYNSANYKDRIGVFAGAGLNTYLHQAAPSFTDSSALKYQAFIGNDKDFLATRVSYKLNLKGPSINVQTACSTSLVAVHLACQSLIAGECEMALAGGVGIRTPQNQGYFYEEGGILSPDAHCRAFDKDAKGTVFGSGVGVVVLKPLARALADRDTIYAVIKGSAINNDGGVKIGYTAPSVDGQAEVIAEAMSVAGVEPESITYVEAHGTGTTLGDPIEVAALKEAFGSRTNNKQFCAIGSIKTNIGHLDTAAGIAGLIKAVCALRHRRLPPSLNFTEPNPKIDFANSPFYVNAQLKDWTGNGKPRRAGVSSFGIGGTNAHVILEEAPPAVSGSDSRPWQLLTLSAKTSSALDQTINGLVERLKAEPQTILADVCYTLQTGRRAFAYRRAVVCKDTADAGAVLESLNGERFINGFHENGKPSVAFLFPGQGSQHVNMAREVYETEAGFAAEVDACIEILKPHLGLDLRELLFVDEALAVTAGKQLEQTALAQPALFVIEYALARLWMDWGVTPSAIIGHSIGEYVAACLSGVFALEDSLRLVAARGRLMQSMPGGAMLSVQLSEAEVMPLMRAELSLAAVNGPSTVLVSGPFEAVADLEKRLAERRIVFTRLHTSHAFHSSMMDPIIEEFTKEVLGCNLRPPAIPFVSNLTGTWITNSEATDPHYWARHLRQAVRFSDGLRALLEEPDRLLLEVGPGNALSTLARQQARQAVAVSSLPHPRDKQPALASTLNAAGRLWVEGVEIDWEHFYAREKRRRVSLPAYPFEGERYWIKSGRKTGIGMRQSDLNNWFYAPAWHRSVLGPADDSEELSRHWLVIRNEESFSQRLVEQLRARGFDVTTVSAGDGFTRYNESSFSISSSSREDYNALIKDLSESGRFPNRIVHAWNVTPSEFGDRTGDLWEQARCRSFDSLLFLTQALERSKPDAPVGIAVLSSNMQKVCGEQFISTEKSLLLGPVKVIPQEHPNLSCLSLDLTLPQEASREEDELINDLIEELVASPVDQVVAYRGGERWVQSIDRIQLDAQSKVSTRLRDGGVYLITGGLGGIGLTLAEELARLVKARLVLIGRSAMPERQRWDEGASPNGSGERWTEAITKIRLLEEMGSEVLTVSADVTDAGSMEGAIRQAEERFGTISGVIHAAGIAGGGIIQLKTPDSSERVLAPKVLGTLVLQSALKDHKLDFFILCSSINSIIGGFGQSDYCAANAFCDSFAQANFHHRQNYVASINWDRWDEVGMAARPFTEPSRLPVAFNEKYAPTPEGSHPLLDACVVEGADRMVFISQFSPDTHWVLSDHKVSGVPTVPGTAYLEMARAAFAKLGPKEAVELRGVTFRAPLMVDEGQIREVVTLLDRNDNGYAFRIMSRLAANAVAQQWEEHARGEIGLSKVSGATSDGRRHEDANRILATGRKLATNGNGDFKGAQKFITTGPRWNSLSSVHIAGDEALAVLDMADSFESDLSLYVLHPSLLDIATGFIQYLVDGDYLPLVYEQLTVRAPIPRRALSHVKLRGEATEPREVITCDISICDETGAEAVRVEGFSMKRVAEGSLARPEPKATYDTESSAQKLLSRDFGAGISPKQGAEIFRRVLVSGRVPQIIVSTEEIREKIDAIASRNRSRLLDELESIGPAEDVHARPPLSSAYTEPNNDLERRMAAIWQRVLGIEQVGINDSFFELGGTSLTGIRLVSELKKEFKVDIPVVSIFEASTIAALARYLSPKADPQAVFEQVQDRAEKKKQALKGRQQMAGKKAVLSAPKDN
ncbi:MAG: amino acid adenylation domain-containing protein [Blastocatellia bacterium]